MTATIDPDARFHAALDDALTLVDVVHGNGSTADVDRILRRADIPALCIALAACVDHDKTITDLLGWTLTPTELEQIKRVNELAAAHAYYVQLRTKSQPVPPEIVGLERLYQRNRKETS